MVTVRFALIVDLDADNDDYVRELDEAQRLITEVIDNYYPNSLFLELVTIND